MEQELTPRQIYDRKYYDKSKENYKQYYQANKEQYKARYKKYYEKNKERVNEYNRQYWKSYYISKKPYPLKICESTGMQIQQNVTVKFTF
jgi:hypothetical protein